MRSLALSALVLAGGFLCAGCVWKSDFEALRAKQRDTLGTLEESRAEVARLEAEKAALEGNLERTRQELEKKVAGLEEDLAERQRESAERLEKMKRDLDQARQEGSEKLSQLQGEYDLARQEAAEQIATVESDLERTRQKAAAAQEKIEQLTVTYDSLVENLQEEIEDKSVRISRLKNNLQIDLVDKILFDSGSAEVNPGGQKVLRKVSNALRGVSDRRIVVEGHTDNVPIRKGPLAERYPTNWELSAARAVAVVRLLQHYGVPAEHLVAAGYGPYHPVAPNTTPRGRSQNRRIEIVLEPLLSDSGEGAAGPDPAAPKPASKESP